MSDEEAIRLLYEEAEQIAKEYWNSTCHTDEDTFVFVEALKVLANESDDPHYALCLADYYMANNRTDLADKVIDVCIEKGVNSAYYDKACLIDRYETDSVQKYEKLYYLYNKCLDPAIVIDVDIQILAQIHLAHMYREGLYVEKSFQKYKELIDELYEDMMASEENFILKYLTHNQDIYYEKAQIARYENNTEEAVLYYKNALKFYIVMMKKWPFEYENMMEVNDIVRSMYELTEFEKQDMNLLDLLYLSDTLESASFYTRDGVKHTISFSEESGSIVGQYNDKWYSDPIMLLYDITHNNQKLYTVIDELYGWELSQKF